MDHLSSVEYKFLQLWSHRRSRSRRSLTGFTSSPPLRAPKWYKRKARVSFGFGGKLVSFHSADTPVGSSERQLETLSAQMAGLEDMLKEMKRKDDILPKLMTSTGSHEDLFRKELSKYDNICEEIAKNLEAQDHLLMNIQIEMASLFEHHLKNGMGTHHY